MIIMIIKKIVIFLFIINFLNGCGPSTALLGPTITLVGTGNVYQTGISYGSSKAVEKITGKTTSENIKSLVFNKNTTTKEKED